ncbi:putative peptide maturation dehydrogenase [Stenotrophomonas indicatrix]|uniref:putative peptide maturation dehydrogenase n=1 Tax=Stenotrophomonas indicatrix TaxID=2045451 RepID=UPI001AA14621|nr:putative peptide maturation dehydrogenase [Stenotrophomonas indicatrix]MBO1747388.1 putative peptide maturation dehydrogenase [Stenotrophomonas indicatrix]
MQIRRCAIVMFEPRSEVSLDLSLLLQGQAGLVTRMHWQALAAHLDAPVEVSIEEIDVLGRIEPDRWVEPAEVGLEGAALARLLEIGLVISQEPGEASHRDRDQRVRDANWWPLSALQHRMGRWGGINSAREMREHKLVTAQDLHARFGAPPAAVDAPDTAPLMLPDTPDDARDELLRKRATCRNFDAQRTLALPLLAQVLKRTVQAHAALRPGDGMEFLKKNIPSGGGLHPLETYVVALAVDGLAPGVYHYHPLEHALRPVAVATDDLRTLMLGFVSGQDWFADAPLHIIQVARFPRSFWKYRSHPKAYRAVLLDAGHLSQQWMLSATELGLAAYVTAAINEIDVEKALGLDGIDASPVMICGLGWRADAQVTSEFDPLQQVWRGNPALQP